ncbi:MAG: flagellin [Actinomycetota bacterium]|nr:flagellin [Actinomycetota bacterium]
MALRVNNNVAALNAYRNLTVSEGQQSKSLEKLSSGFRINRAADDAAGLAISESLRSQVGGLKVAGRNAQDGVSVVQTAEGALTEVHSMLQRMRDLAVQSANTGANGGIDANGVASESIKAADAEVTQLKEAINQIAQTTQFNGTKLLDGSSSPLKFQVGANAGEELEVKLVDVQTGNLGGANGKIAAVDLKVAGGADAAIGVIDDAIKQVSSFRGDLGAAQNRLEHTIANLSVTAENLSASESRIRDADMAQEMLGFTRSQILSQAGTAMLAQANQSSQGVLSLLR